MFFKKKINFESFIYAALQQIFAVYDKNKEQILDKAQWENQYKMTSAEREKLWDYFNYFIPIGLIAYGILYFDGNKTTEEISEKVTKTYILFLNKEKGYSLKDIETYEKKLFEFWEQYEKIITKMEESGKNKKDDLITNSGIAFANIFCESKIIGKDPLKSKESQMNFAALKLSKSYITKGAILDKLFKEFKITFN